jgi:hypothetical protein
MLVLLQQQHNMWQGSAGIVSMVVGSTYLLGAQSCDQPDYPNLLCIL